MAKKKYCYNKGAVCPPIRIKNPSGVLLTRDVDYTVTYKNNTRPGTAYMEVTGIGKYKGQSSRIEFTIVGIKSAEAFADDKDHLNITIVDTQGYVLKEEMDYRVIDTIYHTGSKKEIFVEFLGFYEPLNGMFISIPDTPKGRVIGKVYIPPFSYTYTGEPIHPFVIIKDTAGHTIPAISCKVEYQNNVHAGEAAITVSGTGDVRGRVTVSYTIKPAKITKAQISWERRTGRGVPEIIYRGKSLEENTDYVIETEWLPHKFKVTIRGIGDFIGTVNRRIDL